MDEGRLDVHEFDERVSRVYTARTYGELTPLLSDLPAQRISPSTEPRGRIPQWVLIMWTPWVFVNLLCVLIWLATGMGYFWPFWVEAPWGLALCIPTVIGLLVRRSEQG